MRATIDCHPVLQRSHGIRTGEIRLTAIPSSESHARHRAPDPGSLLAAAVRLRQEVSKRIVGQQEVLEEILLCDRRWRTRPPRQCPRTRQDADDSLRRRKRASRLPPSVHPRSRSLRHHRHGENGGEDQASGHPLLPFSRRTDLRQHHPRGRNQPLRPRRRPRCSRRCRSTA